MADFVHLHLHSDFSLLDGACRVDELVRVVHDRGMRAVALTDHGHLFGSIEFYSAALARGVKPILGIEAYIAPRSRFDRKDVRGVKEANHHLTLLVKNEKGWANLQRLTSLAYLEGFYYKPRMDRELLAKHHEGLIALSGCPNSAFGHACKEGDLDRATKVAGELADIFGKDNFYLEIQDHGLDDESRIRKGADAAAKALGLRLVATNDVHYLTRDDAKAHDALLAISTGTLVSDPDRLRYDAPEFYIKSPDEMARLFAERPDAVRSTVEIAEKCNLELKFGDIHLPRFELPEGRATSDDYLRELTFAGAREKFGDPIPPGVGERLDYELGVVKKMGFASYFLIVWDLRRFARSKGIRVGPGRGSAAGSLVGYCLGITSIDPLRYDLIFERFLNPSRKEMPDIDLDFSNEDRAAVIDYIREKYGKDTVAQIITYGTMKARAVLRDVGRVMGVPLSTVDQLAKKVPKAPVDITLLKAAEAEPDLLRAVEADPALKELWEMALRLEGLNRHAGKHASGVVIGDRPLTEIVPVCTVDEAVVTQFDMNALTKLGLLKIDILGLETLTVLDRAVKLVEKTRGVKIQIDRIPLDDRPTYQMLGRGQVKGVFQMETSRGMRELVQNMKPDRIEDVIATIALFRPGPLGTGMVEQYVNRKHGREPLSFVHPSLEPILKETYGVILYQEQVMKIANVLANFSMADADALRKAMGKKKPELLASYRDQFIAGARRNGIPEETGREIFDLMAYFAGYGFNKSHSAAYGIISYQTAYLKANFPVEYMAALLSCAMGNTDKVAEYLEECRQLGIEVLPPDVNASELDFVVESLGEAGKAKPRIRFGLGAIKGIGNRAIGAILEARAARGGFKGLYDFCERIDHHAVEAKAIESLIKCGAFDSTGLKRAQAMEILEPAVRISAQKQADARAGQLSFFGDVLAAHEYPPIPDVTEWAQDHLLAFEKEALGYYVTSNPVVRYEEEIKSFSTSSADRLPELEDGAEVVVGGLITGLRAMFAKSGPNQGKRYVAFRFQDLTGSCEGVVFPNDFEKNRDHLMEDAIVFLRARVGFRNEEPSLRVQEVIPIHLAREQLAGHLTVRVPGTGLEAELLKRLREVFRAHPGACAVHLAVDLPEGKRVVLRVTESVTPTDALMADLEALLGPGRVRMAGKPVSSKPLPFRRAEKSGSSSR